MWPAHVADRPGDDGTEAMWQPTCCSRSWSFSAPALAFKWTESTRSSLANTVS